MPRSEKGKPVIGRRGFLAGSAAGLGTLALNGTPLSVTRALAAGRSPAFPNYYPANVAPPDIAATARGGEAGWVNFPKKLVKSVTETPAKGGEVSGMSIWIAALPTPMERNTAWQNMNKQIGATYKLNLVPQADYAAKWGTVTASGDLPDMMYISTVPVLPNIAAFVKASCADLSEYLGGDAVKDYPNLANLPSVSWNAGMLDGRLWGVPRPTSINGWPMFVQTSLLEKLGMAGAYPKNADEFKAFCKAVTNPSQSRWAFGVTNDTTTGPYSMSWFQGVFRAPNNWRLGPNGSLVKDIESEEYKAALAYLRELVQLGYMSPDVKTNADLNNDLYANKILMRANAWNAYQSQLTEQAAKINQVYRIIPPFGHDGGKPGNMQGLGNFGWVAFKKSSPDRIKEILRVANYFAAPFGTEEFMVNKFGIEGEHYTYNDKGTPVFTPKGLADMPGSPNTPWAFLGTPAPWLYSTTVPDFAKFASVEENLLLDANIADPTIGFYSATDARKGAQLSRLIFDRVSSIAAGRAPVGDLDQLVKDWKAQGGDEVRAEYEKAIAA